MKNGIRAEIKVGKSSKHSQITHDFAEHLVFYWLSKHNFECKRVTDGVVNLVARNPLTGELMGISVKSRSRILGQASSPLYIQRASFLKIQKTCQALGCNPYFAIVIDIGDKVFAYIISAEETRKLVSSGPTASWKMRDSDIQKYATNPQVASFEFLLGQGRWWSKT